MIAPGTIGITAPPTAKPRPCSASQACTPPPASSPNAEPPASTRASIRSTVLARSSNASSRVPGPPPRTSITGPAGEGTLFTFGPDPRNKATAKSIVERFKAKGIDPEGYTLYTYAAMQVWSQAVAKAGTTDPKKVMDTIKGGAWDTVIGKMEFDAKGDIKQIDYVVYKWDAKGYYTEINPKGS